MIGGTDITIPTPGGCAALDCCLRVIYSEWPSAVFEDAESEERAERFEQVPEHWDQIFVYRDPAAARSWEALGADPSNANSMIHLLLGHDRVTVVVDDPADPTMRRLLDSLHSALSSELQAFGSRHR